MVRDLPPRRENREASERGERCGHAHAVRVAVVPAERHYALQQTALVAHPLELERAQGGEAAVDRGE
ncbi:hypothetical protein AB1Y20_018702 [Prymnesium parvum]|uniref:Uncharacterized protein n=1 Tax=Prymnesium parvum TaxID=97485 RepID=A0AB34JSJ1_PRYPA